MNSYPSRGLANKSDRSSDEDNQGLGIIKRALHPSGQSRRKTKQDAKEGQAFAHARIDQAQFHHKSQLLQRNKIPEVDHFPYIQEPKAGQFPIAKADEKLLEKVINKAQILKEQAARLKQVSRLLFSSKIQDRCEILTIQEVEAKY